MFPPQKFKQSAPGTDLIGVFPFDDEGPDYDNKNSDCYDDGQHDLNIVT